MSLCLCKHDEKDSFMEWPLKGERPEGRPFYVYPSSNCSSVWNDEGEKETEVLIVVMEGAISLTF